MNAAAEPQASSPATERDWKTYGVLAALYVPIIYPILRANRYYEDDLGRSLIGRQSWDATGRPLTTLLMRALQCYDHAMVDISPLPQIAAIAVLAWLGVLIARRFAIRSPWVAALAALPLGAQPFFLENLSYKFDALSMALAMFFVLLPIVRPGAGRRGWWLGILWLFIALNLYQAAINAYLLFILLEMQWSMTRRESLPQLWRQLLARVVQAAVGMLVYQLLIGMPLINGWVKRNSQKIHNLHELAQLPANIADFYRYIGASFDAHWWMYFALPLLILALLPAVACVRYAWSAYRTRRDWPAASLLLANIGMPLIALLCVMGPMLTFVKPFLAPRVMMGVGAWLSTGLLGMYFALEAWRRSSRWMLAAGWMLAVGMMVIAGAYGNALSAQAHYEAGIATRLADDYAGVRGEAGAKALLLDGTPGYAPATVHAIGQFPVIERLISVYLNGADSYHTGQYLAYYLPGAAYIEHPADPGDPMSSRIRSALTQTCSLKPVRFTSAYEMYMVGNTAIAIFHQQSARRCDLPVEAATDNLAQGASLLHTPL